MIKKHQFVNKKVMPVLGESLSEHISSLESSGDMWERDNTGIICFINRMTIHFNMLSTLMKYWVSTI
jgi:hypothetical protein